MCTYTPITYTTVQTSIAHKHTELEEEPRITVHKEHITAVIEGTANEMAEAHMGNTTPLRFYLSHCDCDEWDAWEGNL